MVSAIESAIYSLVQSIPSAAHAMRHGDETGSVLASSSRELSGDTVSADAPAEVARVVGRRCDFPTIAKGETVEMDGAMRIVTGARTDPVGASLSVGLSAPLDAFVATYRRGGTQMLQPVRTLAVESEAPIDPWSDAVAPTTCRSWFCCVSAADWYEETEPQVGDELTWDCTRVRVSAVAKHDGYWILTARARR